MNADRLTTVGDWVSYYRHEFALPVTERGGFVMLPVTTQIGVVHLPVGTAEKVRGALQQQRRGGPILARHIRWSFLAEPDSRPGKQIMEALNRLDIGIPVVGSAVMLPTGLGRWTREGCHWVTPPARDSKLPPLSAIITTALAVGTGSED
ncbi:hypothetical protein [Nocardia aurantiaca]|uniref:Uncharacterized protein n=1 Tax=Nocardia aurantiaca TaxID=2675850 RepID=A0A6I3L1U4_9NOCA|nr:hypothetical protein [Nocardia aurantiaca]MTE14790.1 hypothetical protein [Nocardia aurantiaca]